MDDTYFIEVYEAHKTPVFRLAYSYLKTRESAEDITQSVFFKFYKNPPKDKSNIPAYLAVMTKNLSIDVLRKNKREIEVAKQMQRENEILSFNEESPDILFFVEKLSERHKTVIKMYYYGDLSIKETAVALKKSEASVKKTLERARNKLKQIMEQD